jgi:hypothetical protein
VTCINNLSSETKMFDPFHVPRGATLWAGEQRNGRLYVMHLVITVGSKTRRSDKW